MVFYRKYRPQTLDELDSEFVKTSLKAVLSSKNVPHAFLFTGPKGLGKTSTARIVAKYLNCLATKGEKPCNVCASCTSITEGTNMDVLEIDGASNRGIDEIRDLREKIRLLPVAAKMKVYIIDEVHMLTTEAFNALLKTLEEPPAHAVFVLCTTESHKVPGTILSRCFHVQFKKASTADLVASFERIIQGEKLSAEKEALEMIASFADGSFRDGAKVLEEIVVGLDGKKVTKDIVENTYHVTSVDQDLTAFLTALIEKDTKKGLTIIQNILEMGVDMRYFIQQVLLTLHRLLLEKAGISDEKSAVVIDLLTIQKLAAAFEKAHAEMKYAVLPQLPLELLVLEWTAGDTARSKNEELGIKNNKNESVIANAAFTLKNEGKQSQVPKSEVIVETASSHVPRSENNDDTAFFHQLLDVLKVENHMLAGVLRSCKMKREGKTLVIEAPSSFHKDRLEDPKALSTIEAMCKQLVGQAMTMTVVLK